MTRRRKLIEAAMPLQVIDTEAAREKAMRPRHNRSPGGKVEGWGWKWLP